MFGSPTKKKLNIHVPISYTMNVQYVDSGGLFKTLHNNRRKLDDINFILFNL